MRHSVILPFGCTLILDIESGTAESTLERIQARLKDRKKLLRAIANALRADIRRQFAVGGSPKPWEPLKPSTIFDKEAAGLPALTAKGNIPRRLKQNGNFSASNILIRTGRLRDSWGRLDHPDHIERRNEQTGEIDMGTKVPCAAVHQFGGLKEYKIEAKNAPFLVFMGPDGKLRKKKAVIHPPLPARPVRMTEVGAAAMATAFKNYLVASEGMDAEILTPD